MVVITFEVWPSKPAANNNSGLIVILVLLDPLERKLADLQAQSFRQIDPDDYRYSLYRIDGQATNIRCTSKPRT